MKLSWIDDGLLAAGSLPYTAEDLRSLRSQGVRSILSLTEHPITRFRSVTPALLAELGIECLHAPVVDNLAPDEAQAARILAWFAALDPARPAYVHCNAGIGRTGTVLQLYFLWRGHGLEEAERLVRARRQQCVLISPEQRAFLRRFVRDP
ncbi:MAG TPA: hypothetical protein VGE07_13230 [Herpetosiphonaceae bacterium]